MSNQFDKSKLPSRHVSVGPERAPHRSYYYAMGLTAEEIARPFVGVVSAGNDSAPCNTTLDAQADIARVGVEQGGGMPRRFNTITVTDGIAMGHQGMKSSLVSREVIADSVELSVRGHCYDALVGFAGCDDRVGRNKGPHRPVVVDRRALLLGPDDRRPCGAVGIGGEGLGVGVEVDDGQGRGEEILLGGGGVQLSGQVGAIDRAAPERRARSLPPRCR